MIQNTTLYLSYVQNVLAHNILVEQLTCDPFIGILYAFLEIIIQSASSVHVYIGVHVYLHVYTYLQKMDSEK